MRQIETHLLKFFIGCVTSSILVAMLSLTFGARLGAATGLLVGIGLSVYLVRSNRLRPAVPVAKSGIRGALTVSTIFFCVGPLLVGLLLLAGRDFRAGATILGLAMIMAFGVNSLKRSYEERQQTYQETTPHDPWPEK